jgi:hypothetical protein
MFVFEVCYLTPLHKTFLLSVFTQNVNGVLLMCLLSGERDCLLVGYTGA